MIPSPTVTKKVVGVTRFRALHTQRVACRWRHPFSSVTAVLLLVALAEDVALTVRVHCSCAIKCMLNMNVAL
jgi:hypothetical protein